MQVTPSGGTARCGTHGESASVSSRTVKSRTVDNRLNRRPAAEQRLLAALWRRRPRVVVKADLLPAVSVLSFVALAGVPVAWIWSRLAPPERLLVPTQGAPEALPEESFHVFDGIALTGLLGLGAGLLIGAAVWLLRERRGPVIMVAAVLGALLAGWLATQLGASFANGLYPAPGAPHPGSVVVKAPEPGGWVTLVPWAFGVAITYGVLAVWNGMDDLGRRLS